MSTSLASAASLHTASPAAGQTLARQLAADLLGALPARAATDTMAAHLRTDTAARPAPEVVTAIYFHAITLANDGWRR